MPKTKGARPATVGGVELSNEDVLNAADGFARLLKVRLPAILTFDLQRRYQVLKFAAVPVNESRDALVKRFEKKDRKGRAIPGEQPGTVLIRDPDAFNTELLALMKKRQRVNVEPLKRSEIPEKVDGKAVIIEGEVWEFLVD